MVEKITRRGGKKGRKIGRSKRRPGHTRYNNEKRWIGNKIKKLKKHLKKYPKDKIAVKALSILQGIT